MIQSLKVKRLNDRFDYDLEFNEDMNIITGQNGSGKTTLLKLIWYLTSGNLHRIIPEISLTSVQICTSEFDLSLQPNDNEVQLKWYFDSGSKGQESFPIDDRQIDDQKAQHAIIESVKKFFWKKSTVLQQIGVLNMLNKKIAEIMPGSLFFSTFGKFEGTYTAEPTMMRLQEVLSEFAEALSVGQHKFMPEILTDDLTELLKQKYIVIQNDIDPADDKRQTFVDRWELLDEMVEDFYGKKYGGIRILEDIILGKNHNTENLGFIPFNNLSFGERRSLGFLYYNAFSDARTIFINELESSLNHVLQRQLPLILKRMGTEKQIFLTTRSPSIFKRVPEKTIELRNSEQSKS